MKSLFIVLASLSVLTAKKFRHLPQESDSLEDDGVSIEDTYTSKMHLDMKGTLKRSFALASLRNYVNNIKLKYLTEKEAVATRIRDDVICSPLSALLPLGKLILGTEPGRSRNELLLAIGIKKASIKRKFKELFSQLKYLPGVTLTIASRLYVDKTVTVQKKYIDSTESVFQSSLERIDFRTAETSANIINDWVNTQTKGMIPNIVKPSSLDPNTSMILVNAVYFLGRWIEPFTKLAVGNFYSLYYGIRRIPMMTRKAHYSYVQSEILNAQIISIPYEGMKASFVIVLPVSKTGLPMLLSQLKVVPDLLNIEMAKMKSRMVNLTIPKFKIETELDLKTLYENIGVTKVFTEHSGLTRISTDKSLYLTRAIQKACIEVSEIGTEASAATKIEILHTSSFQYNEIAFTAEHPFLFFVSAEQQQLFAGVFNNVGNPIENAEITIIF